MRERYSNGLKSSLFGEWCEEVLPLKAVGFGRGARACPWRRPSPPIQPKAVVYKGGGYDQVAFCKESTSGGRMFRFPRRVKAHIVGLCSNRRAASVATRSCNHSIFLYAVLN